MEILNTFIGKTFAYPFKKMFEWRTDVVGYKSNIEQRNELWSEPRRHWSIFWKLMREQSRDNLVELFNRARGMGRTFLFEDPKDYEASDSWNHSKKTIEGLNQADKTFTLTGQLVDYFTTGRTFAIKGSTGNDDTYTTVSSSQNVTTDDTTVIVSEVIPSAVVDGFVYYLEFQLYKEYYPGETESWSEVRREIQPGEITVNIDAVEQTEGAEYTLDDATGIIVFTYADSPGDGTVVTATFKFYFRIRFTTDMYSDNNITPDFWTPEQFELLEVKPIMP